MESAITAYRPAPAQFWIALEGLPFIAIALFAALVLFAIGTNFGAALMVGMALFTVFFFRNPERVVPAGTGIVVAPADGRVLKVEKTKSPYTGEDSIRVCTFMSVFNVHINRFPVEAKVEKVFYHPGKFFVASLDKASEHNERNGMVLVDNSGRRFTVVQIAGLVARRIISYVKPGDHLTQGARFGLIRFGSRVDLYLPPDAKIEVREGQKVSAGETVMGRLP
jgi:phosphatidylserine decarboxylase